MAIQSSLLEPLLARWPSPGPLTTSYLCCTLPRGIHPIVRCVREDVLTVDLFDVTISDEYPELCVRQVL